MKMSHAGSWTFGEFKFGFTNRKPGEIYLTGFSTLCILILKLC